MKITMQYLKADLYIHEYALKKIEMKLRATTNTLFVSKKLSIVYFRLTLS